METESCKIRGDGVNETINYYNKDARIITFLLCDRFLNYVITDRRIKDIGGGIGRDIKYFESRGYKAASELCRIKRT